MSSFFPRLTLTYFTDIVNFSLLYALTIENVLISYIKDCFKTCNKLKKVHGILLTSNVCTQWVVHLGLGLYTRFNPFVTNGLSYPNQMDESAIIFRGIMGILSIFISFSTKFM